MSLKLGISPAQLYVQLTSKASIGLEAANRTFYNLAKDAPNGGVSGEYGLLYPP
jgi:hypothetical protein